MKVKIKKIVALFCVFSVLICGCNKKERGDDATVSEISHAYTEYKVMQFPDMMNRFECKKMDGTFFVLGLQSDLGLAVYKSENGMIWENIGSEYAGYLTDILDENDMIVGAALNLDMSLAYVVSSMEDNREFQTIHLMSKEGKDVVFDTPSASIKKIMFSRDKSGLYVCMDKEVMVYDLTGKLKNKIDLGEYIDVCEDTEGKLLVLSENGMMVYQSDGSLADEKKEIVDFLEEDLKKMQTRVDSSYGTQHNILFCDEEGTVYILLESGVYRYMRGSVLERIVSDNANMFGQNDSGIYAILVNQNDVFVFAGRDNSIEEYVYSEEKDNEAYVVDLPEQSVSEEPQLQVLDDGKLTIYSVYESDYLERMVRIFKVNHPNVVVEVEIGIASDSGINLNDAVQALNTTILSGDGPDVILMDGLDVSYYINNGALVDMTEIYNSVCSDYPNLQKNILGAYKQKDGDIYAMPTRFSAPILVGKRTIIEKINDFYDVCDYLSEFGTCEAGNELQIYYPRELYENFEPMIANYILDENGDFDVEMFRQIMTSLKKLWDVLYEETSDEELQNRADELVENPSRWANLGLMLDSVIRGEIGNTAQKRGQLAVGNYSNDAFTPYLKGMMVEFEGYDMKCLSLNSDRLYEPLSSFSISATCKNLPAAKCFVEELYRLDAQSSISVFSRYSSGGLPIRFFDVKRVLPDDESCISLEGAVLYSQFRSEKEQERFRQIIDSLDTPVCINRTIETIIEEHIEEYFRGDISLDEYVDKVKPALETYLKE